MWIQEHAQHKPVEGDHERPDRELSLVQRVPRIEGATLSVAKEQRMYGAGINLVSVSLGCCFLQGGCICGAATVTCMLHPV